MSEYISFLDLRSDKVPKIIAILIALSSITGGFLLSQPYYFGALALCGFVLLYRGNLKIYNSSIILFLLVCAFSLLINNPPSYFRAWDRLFVYTLVLMVVSPFLVSDYATKIRTKILYYFMQICIVLSIGSFFAYFLGINLFVRLGERLEISAGKFSGLTNHSMVLGPVAGLSCICLFVKILSTKSRRESFFYAICTFIVLGACLLSASRSAVGGAIIGCMFTLYRFYKGHFSKFFKIIFLIIILGTSSFSLWGGLTDLLVQKQVGNEEMGSAIFSRERKFTARILEFKSSPIYGIGYNIVIPEYDGVVMENGQIEPGSSWLAIASMTGIIGLLVFIQICVRTMIKAWKIHDPYIGSILGGILLFFFFHMIAEGYIFAPKSFLSLLFWLTIAVIDGNSYKKASFVK